MTIIHSIVKCANVELECQPVLRIGIVGDPTWTSIELQAFGIIDRGLLIGDQLVEVDVVDFDTDTQHILPGLSINFHFAPVVLLTRTGIGQGDGRHLRNTRPPFLLHA